ncbi:MAG: HAMP domain-containing sensor histidine kinase [Acidimicrobiia bacterium]|jgi:signal transduction histidine kinase
MPSPFQSIRFRLSVLYSAMVFGIGGLVLGVLYLVVRSDLRRRTMTGLVLRPGAQLEYGGITFVLPRLEEQEFRTVESVVKEFVLDQIAVGTLRALAALFLLSLVVGWFLAGWALRPIDRITRVAADIQATDLSRRIALEGPDDELTRLAATFDSMLDRLDRAFASQRRFLADTSHDLRNPLAVIRSNLDLALSDPDAGVEDWRQSGEIALRATERMATMIDDLLATARLEGGRSIRVDLDLAEVAEGTVDAMRARATTSGHGIEVQAGRASARADRDAITRALSNLLDNALVAAPPATSIAVETGSSSGWSWMAVADRGPGVDPAIVRGDSSESAGLGLSIVREVARGHAGRLEAFERPGGGTVIVLWIPSASTGPPPEAPSPERIRLTRP